MANGHDLQTKVRWRPRSMRFSKYVDIFPLFEVMCEILFKYTAAECQI